MFVYGLNYTNLSCLCTSSSWSMKSYWLLCCVVYVAMAMIEEIPLPEDMQRCFDRAHRKGNLTVHIGEKLVWHCVHGSLWSRVGTSAGDKMPEVAMKWFADLIHRSYREADHRRRVRRQAVGRRFPVPQIRIRREYRLLSDRERNLFHRALNMLKVDISIPPNRFEALGRLHEMLGDRAHDGPNFLGWHRLFLIVAENALREKVPTVTIPYWDSTLDGDLVDPRASIIWTPAFMGNGNGRIRTGPFTGWNTPYGPLMRNFGDGGTMMNWTSIRDTFSRSRLAEITHPNADPKANIEDHHGEPHLWVGGHMSPQALAGYDPIFLLHHSFIDLIWELFRRIQRRRGVDPTTDYPLRNTGPPGQRYNDPSGFGNLLNRHALSDVFTTEMYTYQLPPTCSRERPTCGSPYVRCILIGGSRGNCVSASVFDTPPDQVFNIDEIAMNSRFKRSASSNGNMYMNNDKHVQTYIQHINRAAEIKCLSENVNDRYENNFNIDGVSDTRLWSYIPVNVIVKQTSIGVNGVMQHGGKRAAVYSKCEQNVKRPFSVYVESSGLNYRGMYKEVVHIKTDISVTSSMTYIAVKTPSKQPSDIIVSSYDSCGRICRPFCRYGMASQYRPCTGALRVTSVHPLLYDVSVTSLSKNLWSDNGYSIPILQEDNVFIKIVCGDGWHWPWDEYTGDGFLPFPKTNIPP